MISVYKGYANTLFAQGRGQGFDECMYSNEFVAVSTDKRDLSRDYCDLYRIYRDRDHYRKVTITILERSAKHWFKKKG